MSQRNYTSYLKQTTLNKKKKKQKQKQPHANHDSYTCQASNEQGYNFFHHNRDFNWATFVAPVGEERCPVALFKFFVERRPLLQYAMVWFFLPDQYRT